MQAMSFVVSLSLVILSAAKDLRGTVRSFGRYGSLRMTIILFIFAPACAGDPLFGPIGNNVADPISIAIDAVNNRAYLVNANLSITYEGGSLLVLDLTDPTAPAILSQSGNPVGLQSLSGQVFLDDANQRIFVTNRESENRKDEVDQVFQVNVDEAGSFGTVTTLETGKDPFGIACCDPNGRFYATLEGNVASFSLTDPSDQVSRSLEVTLGTGEILSGVSTTRIAILGSQIFLTNRSGRIYVLNANEITNTSANPMDYLITGMNDIRGIATDGTLLYVVESAAESIVRVIDPSTLTPIDPDVATVTEVTIDSIQQTTLTVGNDANELVVFNNKVYVGNRTADTVSVIDIADPSSPAVEATIDLTAGGTLTADEPFGLAAATLGAADYLYVTNLASHNLSIIDLATTTAIATFP